MLMDNLFLISLGVLILVTLFVLGFVLYLASRKQDGKAAAGVKLAKLRFDSLRSSFRQAVELIEGNIVARAERYSIPWVMVLSEGLDQGQLPIEQSGVPSALSSEAVSAAATQGIGWHFFDRGIVIDIQGAYLGSPDDDAAAERPWDEFLGLCSKYRPQRPFDSVVITVPVNLLTDDNPDARLQLAKLAKLAHRRLWLAQNRFAMRFPVYVVVSGCDQIEGFSSFARALPDNVKASMLGWSSPFDLSTTYHASWVDEAVDKVVKTLSDTSAELFALNTISDETARFFLLPSRIDAIRGQLQLYIDELMRPSAYHEPFFFRGIYFTGDSSEAAQRALGIGQDTDGVEPDDTADVPEGEHASGDLVARMMRQPAFLRDLFEKKIFEEYGLARPSRSQQLTQPVLSRAARWVGVGFLVTWGVGLMVAGYQLRQRNAELAVMLAQIQADAQVRARAEERGVPIASEWYRKKALSLLGAIDKLGNDSVWTVFLPGSWHWFDDLDERVAERVEREFGEIAINTLRRELYSRAAELTGVIQEPVTGELVIGADCALPRGFSSIQDAPRRIGLGIDDLSEYAAMLNYLAAAEQLDQALNIMSSLRRPGPNDANDFRYLVKYGLGADLPGDPARAISYFRDDGTPNAVAPAAIAIEPIRQATQCSFARGMYALDQRMFDHNDLLVTEQQINQLTLKLLAPDARPVEFTEALDGYRALLAAIKDQEALLGSGKGGWMKQSRLALGPSFDSLFVRAVRIRLIGLEAAERAGRESASAFARFGNQFASNYGVIDRAGIIWSDKEARFTLSPERLALRDALMSLLNQPFMTPAKGREIPELPPDTVLIWNTQRLEQAVALGEARKRFVAEGLPRFPQRVRGNIEALTNAQFARLVAEYTLDALSLASRNDPGLATDATAYDAARIRLAKVQALLSELEASNSIEDLRNLISQDANNRLRQVDDLLLRSDLYATNVRDFKIWKGEKGKLLQAFGVNDVPALQQYLGIQFSRVEALGRQADMYISAMDGKASARTMPQRWQAINRDLERYKLKNPNSSLIALEQFLTSTIGELDRSNCQEKLAGKGPSRPVDYFGERHQQIHAAIVARCVEIGMQSQREQWNLFATTFNQSLAGRHPFGQSAGAGMARSTNEAMYADFEELGQVLKYYDQVARALKDIKDTKNDGVPSSLARTNQLQAARRFVEQFDRARTFLAPLYPVEEGAVPGYDVAVEFRANQAAEIAGNKVIEWHIDMGGQMLTQRDVPRPLRWEYRTPVTLTLRLAKDSSTTPLAEAAQPEMEVNGKTVRWTFNDAWALFSLIQKEREPDAGRVDRRSTLLRLEFPTTTKSDNPNAPAIDGRSRVYVRLVLSPVGKKTPLFWPGPFPTRAPEWHEYRYAE